jgi:hypothetical protein
LSITNRYHLFDLIGGERLPVAAKDETEVVKEILD